MELEKLIAHKEDAENSIRATLALFTALTGVRVRSIEIEKFHKLKQIPNDYKIRIDLKL